MKREDKFSEERSTRSANVAEHNQYVRSARLITVVAVGLLALFAVGSWLVISRVSPDLDGLSLVALAIGLSAYFAITTIRGVLIREFTERHNGDALTQFLTAAGHLSDDKLETRLAAVFTLEHIAERSPVLGSAITQTVSALIRTQAPLSEDLRPDHRQASYREYSRPWTREELQAAVSMLTRRSGAESQSGDFGPDLHGSDLSRLQLAGAHLERSDLRATKLAGANLVDALLDGAQMSGANLVGANLAGASLIQADLREADLSNALLVGTRFTKADLVGAKFEGATIDGADFEGAILPSDQVWPSGVRPQGRQRPADTS